MSYTASYIVNSSSAQGTTDFTFTFPYIKEEHIEVYLNYTKITQGSGSNQYQVITNVSPKLIRLNTGIASANLRVEVRRNSSLGSPLVDYADGSTLTANDLDTSALQSLYIDQELRDNQGKTVSVDEATGLPTLNNLRLTNVGDPTAAQDAATKNYVDTNFQDKSAKLTELATMAQNTANALADLTEAEVQAIDGLTASTDELNKLDGVTATTAELNYVDGVTSNIQTQLDAKQPLDAELTELATMGSTTASALADLTQAEVQILDGATVTTDELNILDGVTATTTEINYVDGVTSNVQTQLDAKQPLDAELTELATMSSGTASALADLTQAEVETLDGLTATTAELNKLDGVTATTDELNKTDGLLATPTELNTLDGITSNTSELNKLDGVTASTTELNIVAGKTFKTSSGTLDTTSDTEIPSSKVIAAHVASSQTAIGGFVTIADEVSFPNTQPANGVVVSINNAAGVVINGSGVSTSGKRVDNTTVTINGFPSSLNGETLAAGVGLIVVSTSTANTYSYHKILSSETDVKQLSDDINDFNSRYRIAGSAPGSSNDAGDLYFDTSANKMKVYNGTTNAWDDVASVGNFYINTISSSSGTGGGSATFNNNAYRFTLSNPPTMAQQLIVSVNGVIQKPNSGTSQPSEGFAISGNDIIFSAAPASGSDYFIVTQGSSVSIGTPSDNTVTSAKIVDGSIVNGDISSSAAIDGSKIAANSIGAGQIASSAITVSELAVDAVEDDRIKTSNSPAAGKYLQYKDASDKLTWADGASEGTDVKSTGESGGTKFLREDGDGSCSWQNVGGFLPLTGGTISGDTVISGSNVELTFGDGVKAAFGGGHDLSVFHSGTENFIRCANSASRLYIDCTEHLRVRHLDTNGLNDESMIYAKGDGAVELFYDGAKKIETTSSGINVTGQINVNGSALSAAPEVSLVADGAIAANKPVAVQSDGKIKEIKEFAISASNGSATIIDGSQGQSTMISDSCRIGDNKFVAVWIADNDSDKLYAVCCTVSGTTITAGTPVLVASTANDRMIKCAYDPVSDALLIVWVTGTGGSAYVKMRAASISGTSLTFGTELSEAHNSAQVISLCSNENGGFLAAWTGNYASAMQAYTVSGNTITKGSTSNSNLRSDFRPERNAVDIVYHKDDGKYIVGWCLDGGDMKGMVTTVTGTTISNSSLSNLGNANEKMLQLAYDEENKQVFCVYYESSKLYGNIWSISGDSISKANDTNFGNENPQAFRVDYNSDTKKAIVMIRDGNGSTAKKTSWAELTNNSGTPALGSYTQIWTSESAFINISYIGKGKFVTAWRGASEHGYATIWQRAFTDSTLTEGYIGFSSAAINDTATGTIGVVGNTNSSQSGLTAGKKYYVTRTGGLSTTAATPSVEAGIALSSTKLLIKG